MTQDKKALRKTLMIGGVAVAIIGASLFWLLGGRYVSTDDAYVGAPKLMVSADVSGTVSEIDAREGQQVKAGDVLFKLDRQPFEIALASAKSQLAQTALDIDSMKHDYQRMQSDISTQQAQLTLAEVNFTRQEGLLKTNATAKATYDQARATLGSARAQLASLQQQARMQLAKLGGSLDLPVEQHPQYLEQKAKVDEAQRQLDHTIVRAPFDGVVTQTTALQPGTIIISAMAAFMPTSAVALVATKDFWVDANMKETDLTYVRSGNPVEIDVDGYPGHTFHGTVESVAPATGAQFSALPAENTSGNWVKVVQRIPVRILFDKNEDISGLRAGMSVNVSIDTGHRRSLSELF